MRRFVRIRYAAFALTFLAPLTLRAQDLSSIDVPVTFDLRALSPLVEKQVPVVIDQTRDFVRDASAPFGVKYRIRRDPLAFEMLGAGLHTTTAIHYGVEACAIARNPISGEEVMWPCVSCGFTESPRRADVALQSTFAWDPSWRIRSTTRPLPAAYPSRCSVTLLGIDVTDFAVAPRVDEQLRNAATSIDRSVAQATNLKPYATSIWSQLLEPTEIAPRLWLVVEPVNLSVAPIRGSRKTIETALTLRARTRIVAGDRPATRPAPLPPLRLGPRGSGFRIPFSVDVPYAEANAALATQIPGTSLKVDGSALAIRSVKLSPAPNGRLFIDANIDFRRSRLTHYDGDIRLVGDVIFDPAKIAVSLKNVDYQLDSKSTGAFLKLTNRALHDSIRARIEEATTFSIRPQLDAMRGEIAKGLNRNLTSGITLHGSVDAISPASIAVGPSSIGISAVATGKATVSIGAIATVGR